MPITLEYINKMNQPVECEICNKSYTIGRMKAHKQTKMHIENAEKCGVPSSWWLVVQNRMLLLEGIINPPMIYIKWFKDI